MGFLIGLAIFVLAFLVLLGLGKIFDLLLNEQSDNLLELSLRGSVAVIILCMFVVLILAFNRLGNYIITLL
jgi:hypothetical protein